jgi:hypothetical protein
LTVCFLIFALFASSFPSLIPPSSDDKKEAGLVLPHQIHNVTGRLQEVMKESVTTAFSFTKKFLLSLPEDDDNKAKGSNADSKTFFRHHSIHLHVPEGSIPKDGPSAGVALATSFLRLVRARSDSFLSLTSSSLVALWVFSLALNKRVSANIAMTGELSLTGKVSVFFVCVSYYLLSPCAFLLVWLVLASRCRCCQLEESKRRFLQLKELVLIPSSYLTTTNEIMRSYQTM